MSHITQEPSKEEFALGSFLSAMHESNLNGRAMRAAMLKALGMDGAALAQPEPVSPWIEGAPPFPQNQEWFIAITIYGDRIVLKALPEDHSYDYTTADHTYMASKNIDSWMQFPDCEYKPPKQHPDDIAVDAMAAAMKEKLRLAREKGRGGWETCSQQDLSRLLREHVDKGDPRDVANFCAFLYALGFGIAQPEQVSITDEQILALNTGEVFFSESPSKYPECGHGTQYHAGAPGVVGFARAILAAAKRGDV